MKSLYITVTLGLIAALISFFRSWKSKEKWYSTSNILGFFSFLVILVTLTATYHFSKAALVKQHYSDSVADVRQIKLMQLQSNVYTQLVGGDEMDNSFMVPIVIDTRDNLPIITIYGSDNWRSCNSAQLVEYANPMTSISGRPVHFLKTPLNENTVVNYLEQVLQYKILADLPAANAVFSLTSTKKSTEALGIDSMSYYHPFKLSRADTIPGRKVLALFSQRPISKDSLQIRNWSVTDIFLPVGTTISLDSTSQSQMVIFNNINQFRIKFIIESMGLSSNLPKEITGLNTNPIMDKEVARRCRTCYFRITLNAKFFNLENPETIEYKKWSQWLFNRMKTLNYAL